MPDLHKLTELHILLPLHCPLESAPTGMGDLIALRELNIRMGWSSPEFMRGVANLSMLEKLNVPRLVDEVPDFRKLTKLRALRIYNCEFNDVSGFSGCTALEGL